MSLSRSALIVAFLITPIVAQDWMIYDQHVDRKLTRVAYFGNNASPGQYSIDYSAPNWNDSLDAQIDSLKGKRERLGKDLFTRLDTSMDLTIGGVKVAVGDYYLAVGRAQNGDWKLVLYPAAEIRKMKGDAFITNMLPATMGMEVPLTYAKATEKATVLKIALTADKQTAGNATLTLHWGNHQLTAPIVAELGKPGAKKPEDAGGKKDEAKKEEAKKDPAKKN